CGLWAGPSRDVATTIRVTPREIFDGFFLWLALREPGLCSVGAEGAVAERDLVPCLFRYAGQSKLCTTVGLVQGASLCVLSPASDRTSHSAPIDLRVRTFGPDNQLARRLIDQVVAWDRAGRPSSKGLRIRAYPAGTDCPPSANEALVCKRWTQLLLDWE